MQNCMNHYYKVFAQIYPGHLEFVMEGKHSHNPLRWF